jgi:insertion element IS1 protein InsB
MLAYVLAPHQDAALVELKTLLAPFGLTHFYTDDWAAYLRLLDQLSHTVGKANTQNTTAQAFDKVENSD